MKTKVTISKFRRSEHGASMLEYALLTALVSVVVMAAVRATGSQADNTFRTVNRAMGAEEVYDTSRSD